MLLGIVITVLALAIQIPNRRKIDALLCQTKWSRAYGLQPDTFRRGERVPIEELEALEMKEPERVARALEYIEFRRRSTLFPSKLMLVLLVVGGGFIALHSWLTSL